jgi:hypothetical protein
MLIEWAMDNTIKEGVELEEDELGKQGMPLDERASGQVTSNFSVYQCFLKCVGISRIRGGCWEQRGL